MNLTKKKKDVSGYLTWFAQTPQISIVISWKEGKKMTPSGISFCWPCDPCQGQGHWKWYGTLEVNDAYKHGQYKILIEKFTQNV